MGGGFGIFWRFWNVLAVSECSGGFGMFRWFQNVLVVSEFSAGFGTFWWFYVTQLNHPTRIHDKQGPLKGKHDGQHSSTI